MCVECSTMGRASQCALSVGQGLSVVIARSVVRLWRMAISSLERTCLWLAASVSTRLLRYARNDKYENRKALVGRAGRLQSPCTSAHGEPVEPCATLVKPSFDKLRMSGSGGSADFAIVLVGRVAFQSAEQGLMRTVGQDWGAKVVPGFPPLVGWLVGRWVWLVC